MLISNEKWFLIVPFNLHLGCFASGSYDGIIRLYSADGETIAELCGHCNGIVSLSHGPNDTIISGSWDGSARVLLNVYLLSRYGI